VQLRIPSYTRNDTLIFLLLGPVYMVMFNYFLFGPAYFTDAKTFWLASIITFAIIAVVWRGFAATAIFIRQKFSTPDQVIKRLSISILIFFAETFLFVTLIFKGYEYIKFLDYTMNVAYYQWALIMGCVANIIVTTVHEGVYTFENWRTTLKETEELKKMNLQTQLEGLKSQINPHFLFNSLNSLSSLISENPRQAEKFLNEMSKTYRYLLRNNEEEFTTLATELQFIRSYFHLLKTRYGKGIQLRMEVDKGYENHLIAPLTLQLLVENAVKHNMILKDQPLVICMYVTPNEQLVVKNNLQRKTTGVISEKVGLKNIQDKYKLMNQSPITIEETKDEFTVSIPLIHSAR
jgi:sensor histidine kinase YesM